MMDILLSIVSSLTMIVICLRAARRWAKSPMQAVAWGAFAGIVSAVVVFVTVVIVYRYDPKAFYPPAVSMRLSSSLFLGPIAGALLTVILWRRARKNEQTC
jgi:uncharacterized membrane protein YdcZ (DUF606 family)